MPILFTVIVIVLIVASLAFLIAGVVALRRRRIFNMAASLTLAVLLFSWATLMGTIAFAVQGYRALGDEQIAAVVTTQPVGPKRFDATFQFPGGAKATFHLAGNQLYVDARILKWRPIANVFGLHTAYKLDRVAGRYTDLFDEQTAKRTVYALTGDKPLDMFDLRQKYTFLEPLLDTEYGSATYVAADEPGMFEVRVSNSGLLIRKVGAGS
jgi:hypothetical protein